MSVWPSGIASAPALSSSEGTLVSVSVTVDPRYLEDLLDALARLEFPINPQIYHDGAVRYLYADGHEETEPTTIVEFPAYAGRLPQIRQTLDAYGFRADSLSVTTMLDHIHSDRQQEPAPPGACYLSRERIKQRPRCGLKRPAPNISFHPGFIHNDSTPSVCLSVRKDSRNKLRKTPFRSD